MSVLAMSSFLVVPLMGLKTTNNLLYSNRFTKPGNNFQKCQIVDVHTVTESET